MAKKDSIEILSLESNNKLTRDKGRHVKLNHGIHRLRVHFEDLGDTKPQSKSKINQLLTEVGDSGGEPIFNYIMGNKQPLKDKINASVLSFMDGTAKGVIVNKL